MSRARTSPGHYGCELPDLGAGIKLVRSVLRSGHCDLGPHYAVPHCADGPSLHKQKLMPPFRAVVNTTVARCVWFRLVRLGLCSLPHYTVCLCNEQWLCSFTRELKLRHLEANAAQLETELAQLLSPNGLGLQKLIRLRTARSHCDLVPHCAVSHIRPMEPMRLLAITAV